jgi:hypothetical protein
LHAPATSEQTKPTQETEVTAGNEECNNLPDVSPVSASLHDHWHLNTMLFQCSTNNMPDPTEPDNGKGKRDDYIPHTPSSDDLSSPAKFDSSENRIFWKSLMPARAKDRKKVEVYAVRVPKVSFNSSCSHLCS